MLLGLDESVFGIERGVYALVTCHKSDVPYQANTVSVGMMASHVAPCSADPLIHGYALVWTSKEYSKPLARKKIKAAD